MDKFTVSRVKTLIRRKLYSSLKFMFMLEGEWGIMKSKKISNLVMLSFLMVQINNPIVANAQGNEALNKGIETKERSSQKEDKQSSTRKNEDIWFNYNSPKAQELLDKYKTDRLDYENQVPDFTDTNWTIFRGLGNTISVAIKEPKAVGATHGNAVSFYGKVPIVVKNPKGELIDKFDLLDIPESEVSELSNYPTMYDIGSELNTPEAQAEFDYRLNWNMGLKLIAGKVTSFVKDDYSSINDNYVKVSFDSSAVNELKAINLAIPLATNRIMQYYDYELTVDWTYESSHNVTEKKLTLDTTRNESVGPKAKLKEATNTFGVNLEDERITNPVTLLTGLEYGISDWPISSENLGVSWYKKPDLSKPDTNGSAILKVVSSKTSNGIGSYGTSYVRVPYIVNQAISDVRVSYVDENNQAIPGVPDVILQGKVGESYQTEQKIIDGYTFKEVSGTTSGTFTDKEQIVRYKYTKNPVIGADITVKYQDEKGKEIHAPQTIKGKPLGEAYDASTAQYKLDIKGYKYKVFQGNVTGTFTDQPQTVTYIYSDGVLRFENVPQTMSFEDSKISSKTSDVKRKEADWKIKVEDTRLNKTKWRVSAKLTSPLKDSTGDASKTSLLIYRDSNHSDQWIEDSEVDVFNGKSTDKEDYYDVSWSEQSGPLLSIAPGAVKADQYKGEIQWNLLDTPL